MTFEYECQWPSALVDPVAVPLHWGHSVINEKSFLSPWSAIEVASDLAYEVGAPGEIKVEEVIFCKTTCSRKTVRFHPNVLVFQGKDSEREFHTRHIGLNDVHSDVAPHKCPAYEGQNRAGRQAAPSASAGSSSNRHFLDRRLPADVPSYIHHLQHLWRDDLCRPPLDQPYQLRTWYIHHVHQPQWKVPRLVALPGDGTAWHQLILERWRDQIHNDAVLNIAVVFPQVRSTFDTVPVHADLILVQGGPNFCGGLTTVHPPGDDTGRGYTWAASYPRHVGGVGILVGVDAEELLQTHACDVHAGISIPTTTAPSHWMSNGHSFVAVFQDLQGARTTVPTPAIPTASPTAESGEVGEDLTDLSPGTLALSPEAAEESPQVSDSSFDEEELQGVQIFQLGRSVHHCFLRWRTYNFVLFDMLHAIGLHRDMAIGFHVLQAPLIDQHHAEEAVILQRVGDIPAASDSKLVLLDLVIESPTSGPVHPLRETRLLPRLITRLGLVHALGLRSMCDVDDSIAGCVVYYNNVLWEATNIEVRTIDHGAYLRIIVPQRHDQLVEEPRLKRTIQQCTPEASAGSAKFSRGTRPSTRPDSVDVDASSLMQVHSSPSCEHSCTSLAPRSCSAMFPSLANTHRGIGVIASSRPRPPQTASRQWMLQTRMAFHERATTQPHDEGPGLQMTTWFLHHDRYARNFESRDLRLDAFPQLWYHDLCDLWADTMDPEQEAQVFFVHPLPPSDTQRSTQGHLLLVQRHGQNVPVLLTVLFDHAVNRRVWHLAALVPAVVAQQDILHILDIQRWCSRRLCMIQSGGLLVQHPLLPHNQPGESIVVTITQQALPVEADDVGFMQTTEPVVQTVSASLGSHQRLQPLAHASDATCGDDHFLHPWLVDHKWNNDLQDSFLENSVVEVEEEGPVLYVWTWFIHHGLFPRCREPRIVRLDRKHDNWLRDLLAPWDFACQRATQTQVSIVHPQPPHDALHMETVHVMIEQTPREPVAAAVISIIYHEGPADRLHQEARSLPRWLCTDDLIDIMDLHPICDFQKCTARIGRVPFQQFIRDDIPTATGIELHVKPVFCEGDHTAASSNQPYLPRPLLPAVGRSLMQTVRRWQRTRLLVQPAEDVVPGEHLADEYHMTPQRVADCASLGHHLQPAAFPMWPTSWTTLHEVWTFYFAQTAAPEGMTIRAAVWYSDHVRRPWSEDCRTVTLDANLDLWHAHLVAAWEDWMLPDRQIEIVVVRPVPLGANEDAHFHVIILQQPQPMTKTVILTVMDAFADPWHPGQVCLTVPNAVDHWMLLHAAAVEFQCPPAVPNSRCTTSFGHTDLTAGNLFPVQHGMCFTVTVEGSLEPVLPLPLDDAADPAHDPSAHGVSLLQLHAKFCRVRLSSQVLAAQTQQLLQVFDDVMVELSPTTVPRPLSVHAGCGDTIEAVPQLTSSSTSPVVLSLQATLTPAGDLDAPTYQDELSALQWLHQPNWEAKCAQLSELPLMPLPDGVQIPLESYAAMMDPTLAPAASSATWELYVDGATSATAAAWSVVLVQTDGTSTWFYGQLSGHVELNPTSPWWIGADTLDNIAAEFAAMLVAMRLAHSGLLTGNVLLRPDLRLSKHIAMQECSTTSNPLMAQIMRLYSQWLGRQLSVQEVRGHQHHPWNELADRLAKFALTVDSNPAVLECLQPLHALATETTDVEWAWLQACPTSLLAAFPPLCDGQVMQFPLSLRRPGIARQPPHPDRDVALQSWDLDISFMTVNVLALDTDHGDRECGRRTGTRTQRLDAQWHSQRFHIIGLQEARTVKGTFSTEHYRIWSSGCVGPDAVRLGCELWCHTGMALATTQDGQTLKLEDFVVVVLHADPRRLLVRFESNVMTFSLVVLHTPCLQKTKGQGHRPIDDISQWWDDTAQLCVTSLRDELVWYMVDANAPLATVASASFGLHGAETSNAQGSLFETFLQEHNLVVPSTFARLHVGPTETWTHSSGKKMRRDYMLTSQMAATFSQRTWVLVDHDTTFLHEDHLPLCLHAKGTFQAQTHGPNKIRWDADRLRDPSVVAEFQAALATLPLPTWDVNVDEHCRLYETNLLQLARQYFEKRTFKRKRPQLSGRTLQCIAFKRHLLDCGRAWNLMHDELFKQELKLVEKEVRALVRGDLQIYYDQILVQLQNAGELHDLKAVFRLLTRLGSKKIKSGTSIRPLPALRKNDGTLATSFTEQQQVWMQQFSEIEAGVPLHWEVLQRLDRPGLGPPKDIQCQELFPSPWELQLALKKLKRGKVPGQNQLPPDVLKAGAAPLCHQLRALTTKVVAHCKEPLEWKGGQLIPLSKGKPDAADPTGYRSIFISDFTAKMFHMTMRNYLVQVWENGIQSLQLGGRKRMGVDFAHHFLQAHRHWTASRKLPSAYLFFDIKSAFYSVLRQALFPDEAPSLSLIAALSRFRVSADDIDGMLQAVRRDDATAGISDHFRLLLRDALTNTHFFIKGLDTPCQTHRGTRPGDPLGDLLYNMVMALVMRDARELTHSITGVPWIGTPTPCDNFVDEQTIPVPAFLDLAFVDDCAVAIHAETHDAVQQVVQASVHAMDQAAKRRGLLLNYASGKTEVIFNIRGKGATAIKTALNDAGSRIAWEQDDILYSLKVVHCYKHLGTWLQQGTKSTKEVAHRTATVRQSWGPLHRSFYSKRYVALRSKMVVFQSLTMSRLLYNAHVWSPCSPAMLQKWQNAIRKPLGLIAKGQTMGVSPLVLDVPTLCGLLRLLPPEDQLHMARLRYLKRMLAMCPAMLWQMLIEMIDDSDSWVGACSTSLAWFREFYSDHFDVPSSNDVRQWLPLIQLDVNWAGRIRAAGRACRRYRQACAEHHAWQKQFDDFFEANGGVLPARPALCLHKWTCDQCQQWFSSKRALASHSARVHGYRRIVKFFAIGDVCQSCCRWYHNRSRLAEHLGYATQCLETLRACFPPVSDETLAELDAEEWQHNAELRRDGWGATKALKPMRQLLGPQLPRAGTADAQLMQNKYLARQGQVGQAFTKLQGRCEQPVDHQPQVHLFAEDFPVFVFNNPEGFQIGHGCFDLHGLAREYAILHVRSLVFVHFFSGFRRRGDLHELLDHRFIAPDVEIFVISVDLCLQREQGNLMSSASHDFWAKNIESGRIVGAGGGPPCETFSAARFQDDGPRALRSADFPWGLPALHPWEWRQVLVGTRLLHFLLDMLIRLARGGGCGFCEHPQYPTWLLSKSPASIWSRPAVRALRLLRCIGVTSFDQCIFGAEAVKPTTVLHLRLSGFRRRVMHRGRSGRCPHGAGAHIQLRGHDSDGSFRTARCKIYPKDLNEALADAVFEFCQQTFADVPISSELAPELQPFVCANFVGPNEVQPDYHGAHVQV